MRSISAFKILAKAYCVWAICSSSGLAQDFSSTLEQGPWINSKPYLTDVKPVAAENKIPFVEMMKEALVKGLANPEHQRSVLKIQQEQGTKAQSFGLGYLGKQKAFGGADANTTHGTRWTLFRNAKTYAGKEIHVDIVPESIKKGFRFDQTQSSDAPQAVVFNNGVPVSYGLILKDIEPSKEELRVASIGNEEDYLYFQNAPKAQLEYEIGPVAITPVPASPYGVNLAPDAPPAPFDWKTLVPDHRFRGKFSPRGLPSAAKPLPDQMLSLEQAQGYYSSDILFVNGLHKESVIHRLRLPIYDRFNIYEEFNGKLKPTKIVFTDYFYKGAFSTNLEHYILEKRYRAGFLVRRGLTNLEIYANLPDTALNSSFKRQQRWELSFQSAI